MTAVRFHSVIATRILREGGVSFRFVSVQANEVDWQPAVEVSYGTRKFGDVFYERGGVMLSRLGWFCNEMDLTPEEVRNWRFTLERLELAFAAWSES